MAKMLSEKPTFNEVLLHLNRMLYKETYQQVSGAIFREIDNREEIAYRAGKESVKCT